MPLSEHEQRLLDEMERNLYQNDADFVEPVVAPGRFDVAMLTIGALVAVVGLGAVLFGVIIQQPLVGVLGFVVMLVGVLIAMRRGAGTGASQTAAAAPSAGPRAAAPGFMDRLEDRWQRRLDERDQ
jgi:hypothetical protein